MDDKKLIQFIEAAISNPAHPVYRAGMTHSPALQHYAVNVSVLRAMTGEQWLKENLGGYADQVKRVAELCEQGEADAPPVAPAPEMVAVGKVEWDAMMAQVKALSDRLATEKKDEDDDATEEE